MSQPTPIPVRRTIYELWKQGWAAAQIAEHLTRPVRTVRHLIGRFEKLGEAGIACSYRAGSRRLPPERERARQQAEHLRREHPAWGAGLIRVYLKRQSPLGVPAVRTVQRWLAGAGLGPAPRGRRPTTDCARATGPHEVWQLDASEGIALESGQRVSWLRVADECTGAVLETRVFPLGALEHGPRRADAAVSAGLVRPLGTAASPAGR